MVLLIVRTGIFKKRKKRLFVKMFQLIQIQCVSRIVAYIVKNIDKITFMHLALVNSILHK
jgi:hypothetical protein